MSDCINRECGGRKAGVCLNDFPGVKCYGYEPPRKTHADRLRAMSDEELAEFIGHFPMETICPNNCHEDPDRDCAVCVLDWLREEAKDDKS